MSFAPCFRTTRDTSSWIRWTDWGCHHERVMIMRPDHPTRRPCRCGGTNPDCPQCGGKGLIVTSAFRSIMAGPAGIRRRPFVPRDSGGTIQGPPAPVKCPHCGFEVLNLPAHLVDSHPDQPQGETAAEREAREQEETRQAAVAAEIAQREAEAAQRKAEARARRQAVEGPQSGGPGSEPPQMTPATPPRQPQAAPEPPVEAAKHADLSTPRVAEPQAPSGSRGTTGAAARPPEGPMALAFRLAREKKQRTG